MRTPRVSLRISLVMALFAGVFAAIVTASPSTAATGFSAHGSARQVYVTGLAGGARMALLDSSGHQVAAKNADSLGGLLFRNVPPGTGYRVRLLPSGPSSGPLTVHSNRPAPWDPGVYNQTLPDHGYGYLTTRDGTKLAYKIWTPSNPAGKGLGDIPIPSGLPKYAPPYPTLIEYSGYGYANPAGPTSGIAVLANLMGFAVVDVNMRGTGCSGGAFDFFEPLQSLDGYDVIETIAHQSWVKNHKVGMMGISYGGISQLFTAQTRPPSLAAISPLSVIDATATTLYPGGIRNDGFAVNWAKERQYEARPAGPHGGQTWAYDKIKSGDTVCKNNQVLHGEAADLMAKIKANSHYRPAIADPLDPVTFVHKINVPVFMACQWQDEQTGGHCPALVRHFTGTSKKWFTFTNGVHVDSLDPETYNRWLDFLSIYVAHEPPAENAAVTRAAAPVIFQGVTGAPQDDVMSLPPDPIQAYPTYDTAKAAFDALPEVRVLFDNGAGKPPWARPEDGNPYPGYEHSFSTFPVPNTTARQWYLGPQGALRSSAPASSNVDEFRWDVTAMPKTDFGPKTEDGGLWGNASQWDWRWRHNPAGTAVSYVTAPVKKDTTVIGAGALHLWIRSSTPDVDLQATISEVSPNGKHETFVQDGWLRASERKLATTSNNIFKAQPSLLEPIPTFRQADAAPVPSHSFVKAVIPLYYSGHTYRAGARIRVTVAAPNGTQPIWSTDHAVPSGTATVDVLSSPTRPSSLFLPVVPGIGAPTAQPPCPSLRNEPCRAYQRFTNTSASGSGSGSGAGRVANGRAGTGALAQTGSSPLVPLAAVLFLGAGVLLRARRRLRRTA